MSAVVVSYRTGPALFECLAALLAQPEIGRVVVVDNGNDRPTRTRLAELAAANARLHLVRPPGNIGFARACNLGVAHADGDHIALVNPDLIVPNGCFSHILSALAPHPQAWLASGRLLNLDGSEQRGGRREVLTPWRAVAELLRLESLFPGHPHFRRFNLHLSPPIHEIETVPTVSGAFMVLPRHRWVELGGMDERFFLHLEDTDICLRILKANGQILYCGNVPTHHYRSTSDVPKILVEWHKTISSRYYFHKHFSATYPGWARGGITMLLWGRFLAVSFRALPADLTWLGRCAWRSLAARN